MLELIMKAIMECEERQERLQEVRLHKQDEQLKAQQDMPVRHRITFLELHATDDYNDNDTCNWNSNRWLFYTCYAATTSNPPTTSYQEYIRDKSVQLCILTVNNILQK